MLFPTDFRRPGLAEKAVAILDEMIARGNCLAKFRKAELEHLQGLLQRLNQENNLRPNQTISSLPEEVAATEMSHSDYGSMFLNEGVPNSDATADCGAALQPDVFSDNYADLNEDFLATFGLSSDVINSVANKVILDGSLFDHEDGTASLWTDDTVDT